MNYKIGKRYWLKLFYDTGERIPVEVLTNEFQKKDRDSYVVVRRTSDVNNYDFLPDSDVFMVPTRYLKGEAVFPKFKVGDRVVVENQEEMGFYRVLQVFEDDTMLSPDDRYKVVIQTEDGYIHSILFNEWKLRKV